MHAEGPTPAETAAARLGLDVEIRDVGPSSSMEEHEAKLGVPTGSLCKTLCVRRDEDDYVFVIVSGGRKMAWAQVRRTLGVKRASLATPEQVAAVTGYVPGTVTVFGSRRALPVLVDEVAAAFPRIAVGSGRAGASALVVTEELISAVGARIAALTTPS